MLAPLEVAGKKIRFLVDSGATCNVVSQIDIPGAEIQKTVSRLRLYDRTQLESVGRMKLNIKNPKNAHRYDVEFVVVATTEIYGTAC